MLASVNFDDLTPGIAASIALAYQQGGMELALEKIRETRTQIADAIALEQSKSKKRKTG